MTAPHKTYLATFCHAPFRGEVEILNDALVEVDAYGTITRVLTSQHDDYARTLSRGSIERLAGYILPGFCDLHVHAPQWPQLGKALDVPLEIWLQHYTFPLEARYADLAFARRSYTGLVDDLLANGTTTALYFATVHQDATRLLADICAEKGQRALIGKVVMDNLDQCPPTYCDKNADAALRGTQDFVDYMRSLGNSRLKPVVTPRFIPSCTDAALEGLGAIAQSCGCHIQTHCSESDWQHDYVRHRFGQNDSESLDRFGLLTRHTVLAHGVFLDDGDFDRIAARGSAVAHCPLSNYYFSNAVFPLRRALEKGVRVGLGTDVSGGPSASIFDAMRNAVASSRRLQDGVDARLPQEKRGVAGSAIDWKTAFYMATKGGAEALDLSLGSFEVGRQFDAVRIDPEAKNGTIRIMDDLDTIEDAVQKIIYTASRANIAQVWVDGVLVGT